MLKTKSICCLEAFLRQLQIVHAVQTISSYALYTPAISTILVELDYYLSSYSTLVDIVTVSTILFRVNLVILDASYADVVKRE